MKSTSLLLPLVCALLSFCSALAQSAYTLKQTFQAPANLMSWAQSGYSCAIDGNYLVLGALTDDTVASTGGAVKVFDATTGALLHTITSPAPQSSNEFGYDVALAGNRLVVGARRANGTKIAQGAVYVYDLGGATPTVPALTIPNPVPADNDFFGVSVALSGNRLAVGAYNNDIGATDAGAAYVFDLSSATPSVPVLTFNNPSPAVGDAFGDAVALDGNILAVTASSDDAGATDAGIAYIYDLSSATPATPIHTLNNPDPQANEFFGAGITVYGMKVVACSGSNLVGSFTAGSAYVYDLTSGTPTVPVHTIDNPSPANGDLFGRKMRLLGNMLVISAIRDQTGAFQAGSAYVYDLAGATPTVPVRTLNNPAPATQDYFGSSVAISGTRVFIGAMQDDAAAPNNGTGYLYDMTSATPAVPVRTVTHAGPASENHFGQAVAVSGSRIAVGLPDDDQIGFNAGTVAIFDMSSATPGTPVLKIDTITPDLNSQFGFSLSLEGSRLVAGSPLSFLPSNSRAGQAYVFDLASATPKVPVFTIPNPTGVAEERFGDSVASSGSLIVVGAPTGDTGANNAGSAYVFDLSSATPTVPLHTLNNPTPANSDEFGKALAISGNIVVVGAPYDNTGAGDAGSAYVYDLTSATPTVPVHTLNNPAPGAQEEFGNAVAISGNRVIVAARKNTVSGISQAGSIYEYDLSSATPTVPVRTINSPSPTSADFFGASLSLQGSKLAVGVPGNNTGATDAGLAYVFDLASLTPETPIATLSNPSPAQADAFGTAVCIESDRIAVGMPFSDLAGRDQGAVAVFGVPGNNANLASLTPSLGTLSPAFDAATTSYSIALPGGTTSMTVTLTTEHANATVTVNGNAVTSGNASGSIPLTFGANTITVVVTAEDQATSKTYTITADVAGSGTVAFDSPVFTVASSASGSTADIVVQRSVSNEGAITCTLSSTDGTAIAPTHYAAQSSTPVSLANGVTTAHISIPITAGATTTTAKAFTIKLADINSGATLGSPSTATVVILPPASATDLVKPVATITAPVNAATIVDTLPVTIGGAATDNIGIAKVQVSINGGVSFTDAAVTSIGGTSVTYTLDVQPTPGVNNVRVRAIDFKGNVSAIAARSFTHLRTLTVGVNGPTNSGTVSAGFMPTSSRQVGKSYTITATPKPGFVFDGWTVNDITGTGITEPKLELPTLSFIMQPGLTLTAKFISNPFTPAVIGNFSGLVTASASQPNGGTIISNASTGLCTAKLTGTGALTGNIKVDGLTLPFTAQCDNTGVARFGTTRAKTMNLFRPGKPWLVLVLTADLSGATNRITGTLTEFNKTNVIAQSDVNADRHHFNGTTTVVTSTYVKSYTSRLKARASQGAGLTSHDYPQGDGYMTFKVLANGSVTGSGKLADDTAITMSGNLSQAKHWPIFQVLYGNKGCIAADAMLDDTQTDTDATALNMLWFRPFQNAQWYPYGWNDGIYVDMLASKYTPPPAAVFPGLNPVNPTTGNTDLIFTEGLLAATQTKFVNLTTANVLAKAPVTDASFNFAPAFATGLIGGSFAHTDGTKPKWQGVLMQKGANEGGHGYFMSTKPTALNYLGESGAMHWLAK